MEEDTWRKTPPTYSQMALKAVPSTWRPMIGEADLLIPLLTNQMPDRVSFRPPCPALNIWARPLSLSTRTFETYVAVTLHKKWLP